jgi:hypothetical protein
VFTTNAQIIRAIRLTIERLEQDPEVARDDPALDTLKRLLLRRIAVKDDLDTSEKASAVAVDADALVESRGPKPGPGD